MDVGDLTEMGRGGMRDGTGVTLPELVITLTLLSLLLLLALPGAAGMGAKEEFATLVKRLDADLYLASSEALSRSAYSELRIYPAAHFYDLRLGADRVKQVGYGESIEIRTTYAGHTISFNGLGHVRQGGRITIRGKNGLQAEFVIHPGSGRFYFHINP
ncbi:hypothetical protein BSNK01_06150 [Bacillaceae bacterium]